MAKIKVIPPQLISHLFWRPMQSEVFYHTTLNDLGRIEGERVAFHKVDPDVIKAFDEYGLKSPKSMKVLGDKIVKKRRARILAKISKGHE